MVTKTRPFKPSLTLLVFGFARQHTAVGTPEMGACEEGEGEGEAYGARASSSAAKEELASVSVTDKVTFYSKAAWAGKEGQEAKEGKALLTKEEQQDGMVASVVSAIEAKAKPAGVNKPRPHVPARISKSLLGRVNLFGGTALKVNEENAEEPSIKVDINLLNQSVVNKTEARCRTPPILRRPHSTVTDRDAEVRTRQ
jgi:hypothetical protein